MDYVRVESSTFMLRFPRVPSATPSRLRLGVALYLWGDGANARMRAVVIVLLGQRTCTLNSLRGNIN
jgi:hypothetical protein